MSYTSKNQQVYGNLVNGNNYKPKVAFVYENSNKNMKEVNNVNDSNQINQRKVLMNNEGQKKSVNICSTPKKIENKENNYLNVPCKGERIYGVINQYVNLGNVQNSNQILEKKPNSPLGCRLPPHSPKNTSKRLQQKCPQFLNTKQKEHCENANKNNESILCKCGKNISHKVLKTGQKCCSTCGVAKMIQGFELEAYSPVNLRKSEIYLGENCNSILNKTQGSKILPDFLRELKEEREFLSKSYKEVSQSSQNMIRQFYRQKKLQLKIHYQRIKQAIRESIEQDLRQLEILEKQKISERGNCLLGLEADMKRLEKMQIELCEFSKIQGDSKVSRQLYEQYEGIVARNKGDGSNRESKIDIDVDTIAISGISNVVSNGSWMSCGLLKNMNGQIYRSCVYRMIRFGRGGQGLNEGRVEIGKRERFSQKIGDGINLKNLQNQGCNVLFSFQGKV